MSTLPEESGCWLNRDSVAGIAIRDDVRTAAAELWLVACRRTRTAMGDSWEAAALMELAVVEASRYLDHLGQEASSIRTPAVLLKIFSRLLQRRATRLNRLEPLGRDVEFKASISSWEDDVNTVLFLEKLKRRMSPEGVTIFTSRRDGHSWQEIAQMLQTTVTAVKKRFRRDIENAKVSLKIGPQKRPKQHAKARRKRQGSVT